MITLNFFLDDKPYTAAVAVICNVIFVVLMFPSIILHRFSCADIVNTTTAAAATITATTIGFCLPGDCMYSTLGRIPIRLPKSE